MSNTTANNLSNKKLQQLLAAVGFESDEDVEHNIDAYDYNWQQPHFFSNYQIKKLGRFTENVAHGCAQKFTQLFHNDFNVTIVSTTQHFADEFSGPKNAQNDYYLTIGTEDQTFGLVGIPSKTANIWATQLLGDSNSEEDSNRNLSQLEQSILFDITYGIIEAFSNSYDNCDLHPTGEIVNGQIPIKFEGTEELCKITFSVKKADSDNSSKAYFLIFCNKLQTVVGQDVKTSKDTSPQDISKAMLGHVHTVSASITAQLASTVLTFEEVMNLQVDDILLFDKKVNEPIELIVEDKTLFLGRPAKLDGKHAVVITERCNTK